MSTPTTTLTITDNREGIRSAVTEECHIAIGGLRFHVRLVGNPSAPPVVVLHGIMGHAREWDVLVDALSATHRVIALDQRGHGDTDHATHYSVQLLADDLIGIVEALEVGPVGVVGHSMGAMVAMVAAARRPDLFERLVVIDIGPESVVGELAAMLREFVGALGASSYASVDEAVDVWSGDPFTHPVLLRHFVEHGLKSEPGGGLVWKFDAIGLIDLFDNIDEAELWDAIDRIECPVLLVRGAHSPVLSPDGAQRMLQRFADVRFVVIAEGAHDLGVQQPAAIASVSSAFLIDHAETR